MKFIIIIFFLITPFTSCIAATNLSNWGSTLTNVAKPAGYSQNVNEYQIIDTILKTVFSLLGILFLVLMIYGGFLWMTDRGSSQQVEKAKNLITAAIIGIIIILGSYAISYFVLENLSNKTLQDTTP